MPREKLIHNIVTVAKLTMGFKIPVILSTVNVQTGKNKPTIPQLAKALEGITSYDRTSINAWEDKEFVDAVKATGKKTDHDCPVDGSLSHLSGTRCTARRL